MSKRALGRVEEVGAPAASSAGEGAVGDGSHAVTLGGGEHVFLDAADEDRVGRLLGDEAFEAAFAVGPLRFDDLAPE